jgi:hypothetical protein
MKTDNEKEEIIDEKLEKEEMLTDEEYELFRKIYPEISTTGWTSFGLLPMGRR